MIKKFLNIVSLLLFAISYYFYYLSLEKCFEGTDDCAKKINWIKRKVIQLIISVLIIIFLTLLIFFNIITKFHIFHFIIAFGSFYGYSHKSFFHDHGFFNIIGVFVPLSILVIILFIIKFFSSIIKVKYINKYKFIVILFLFFGYFFLNNPLNCDDWAKGLNNTYIENNKNKYGCQIKLPKKCYVNILRYTQDMSRLSHISCSNKYKSARKKILKFSKSNCINENTMKIGFPFTNNDAGRIRGKDEIVLKDYSSKNLIDMDNIPPELPFPEYIVDFSKDPSGELIINLNYNESLSKERKKFELNSNPYSNNIMIIYIDSISRVNALRKLKKTIKFFEKFISYKGGYNNKYPNEKFHSFQFFKYHSHKGYTGGNYPRLFYGNSREAKNIVRITKYLKENGYITSYATDLCQKDNCDTRHNLTKEELYDHQLLFCDPNTPSFNSAVKKCIYGNINI